MFAWTPSYLSLDLFERLSILLAAHFATLTLLILLFCLFVCFTVFHFFFVFFLLISLYNSLTHSFVRYFFLGSSCTYLFFFGFSFIFISQKLPSKWHAFARKIANNMPTHTHTHTLYISIFDVYLYEYCITQKYIHASTLYFRGMSKRAVECGD